MKPEDHRVTVALGEPMEGVSDVPTVILGWACRSGRGIS